MVEGYTAGRRRIAMTDVLGNAVPQPAIGPKEL